MSNNSSNSARLDLSRLMINLVRTLRLNQVANTVLSYMPKGIQDWVTELKVKNYLATYDPADITLLPVDLLKAKQREALQYLIEKQGTDSLGDYLEFGVFTGTSLSCMYQILQELNLDHIRLFGFDSFEGLPESAATEDDNTWNPGDFKFGYEFTKGILTQRGIDWNRTFLTKGWFCNTLTPEFIQQHEIKKASVIMVDCDLYSSTQDVLKFCMPLIQDRAIVFFDDWNSNKLAEKNLGEKKAFDEYLAEHPHYAIEEFGCYTDHSAVFVVSRVS
ncbi:MAG: hypothetical protein HC769_29725 [Cyanobacteria bacterium CRU_2_1]|nr:hypothetical protein [Cyanobacteria bacterium RU_5_0]NJR62612.1 hypothetical protein [Cyanobacteria bacterium CRU_2_1]